MSETRRGLRIATLEGSAAAVHNVLVGSAFLTGFALAWGANDFQLGLLGAIPFLGSLFQVVGAYVADRWPDHRRLTVALIGLLSRGTWFVIAAAPFLCGDSSARGMAWILALYFFYQATQNASGPGWVAWMAVDENYAAHTIKEYPGRPVYKDYRVMLEKKKGLDAVMVATPDHWHVPILLSAMRLGKKIEWDAAAMRAKNAPEADALIRKAYRAGFVLPT